MPNQSNMNMQGPPRGPPPAPMGPGPNNMGNVQQMPAPHVNPAFFNQNSGAQFSRPKRPFTKLTFKNHTDSNGSNFMHYSGPPQHHQHGHPNQGGMNQPPQNMQHGGKYLN